MKTFMTSYFFSFVIIVGLSFSDVMMRPFDLLPRVAVYLAFPLAIAISFVLIILGSYVGLSGGEKRTNGIISHSPGKLVEPKKTKAA